MNEDMRTGAVLALQGVKEEIDNIIAELNQKGFDEPKGFSVLKKYVEDRMDDFREALYTMVEEK